MILFSLQIYGTVGVNEAALAQSPNQDTLQDSLVQEVSTMPHFQRSLIYEELDAENEEEWGYFQHIPDSVEAQKEYELNEALEVFGWHPFWNGTAWKHYNFSLLSTIAYYSYELDPKTGGYKTIHDWKTTALMDSARAANPGIDILLSVSNFGQVNNRDFLRSRSSQQVLIDSLMTLLALREADGVAIDFEQVGRAESNSLVNFITVLSSFLKQRDYRLVLTLPAVDTEGVYNLTELVPYVDTFVVKAYGYHGSESEIAGPVAPLKPTNNWGQASVATSLGSYRKKGIPNSKIIVGVPYYGILWDTENNKLPSEVSAYTGIRTYRQIKNTFSSTPDYDRKIQSAYYAYQRSDNGESRQLWFENTQTLGNTYDWIIKEQYGGIGIWALGDDNGYTELWELIGEKFSASTVKSVTLQGEPEANFLTVMDIGWTGYLLLLSIFLSVLLLFHFIKWAGRLSLNRSKQDEGDLLELIQPILQGVSGPVFLVPLVSLAILLPCLIYLSYGIKENSIFALVFIADLVYYLGIIAITLTIQSPFKNYIKSVEVTSLADWELDHIGQRVQKRWKVLNQVRVFVSFIVCLLLSLAFYFLLGY